jgi:hypothetical protein
MGHARDASGINAQSTPRLLFYFNSRYATPFYTVLHISPRSLARTTELPPAVHRPRSPDGVLHRHVTVPHNQCTPITYTSRAAQPKKAQKTGHCSAGYTQHWSRALVDARQNIPDPNMQPQLTINSRRSFETLGNLRWSKIRTHHPGKSRTIQIEKSSEMAKSSIGLPLLLCVHGKSKAPGKCLWVHRLSMLDPRLVPPCEVPPPPAQRVRDQFAPQHHSKRGSTYHTCDHTEHHHRQ